MKIEKAIQQRTFHTTIEQAMVNLLYTSGWLNYHSGMMLKQFGITPQQFNVLRILKGQHPNSATVNLIIDRMLDKSSNASRIVDKLETKNLVQRTVCEKDRRRVDVVISDEGMKLIGRATAAMNDFHQNNISLTDSEAEELNRLLNKLRTKH